MTWEPTRYERFAVERRLPFDELVAGCKPLAGGRMVDLGCGTGELSVEAARQLGAGSLLGIDADSAMLERARSVQVPAHLQVEFRAGDLAEPELAEPYELLLSNAALHWVPDHRAVLERWFRCLTAGGQMAVQVPCNHTHPVYELAHEIATAMVADFPDGVPDPVASSVLPPELYAETLYAIGFDQIHVTMRVYCHLLESSADAVDWIRGAALNRYRRAMSDEAAFAEYVRRVNAEVSDRYRDRPYLFTFKRLLFGGVRPPG